MRYCPDCLHTIDQCDIDCVSSEEYYTGRCQDCGFEGCICDPADED